MNKNCFGGCGFSVWLSGLDNFVFLNLINLLVIGSVGLRDIFCMDKVCLIVICLWLGIYFRVIYFV